MAGEGTDGGGRASAASPVGLSGVNHVATVTRDLDALVRFYRGAFGAEVRWAMRQPGDDGARHYLVDLGGGALLHAFENPEAEFPEGMFRRGRIDHLGLAVADEAALDGVRRRLVEMGASDGAVSDFGLMLSVGFTDPDGMACEVCCFKTGTALTPDVDMTEHTGPDPDPVAALRETGWTEREEDGRWRS